MGSLPLGFLIVIPALVYAMNGSTRMMLNVHAVVLVIFGSLGVFALSTPASTLRSTWRLMKKLVTPDQPARQLNGQLLDLSRRQDARLSQPHPLVAYAQELWLQGVDHEMFPVLLNQRLEELSGSTEQAVLAMKNLAKYPPALGMTGTVIGLVSLFSGLTPDKRNSIALSLALAMTATFYGLILANMLIMPIADRLTVMHLNAVKTNDYVYQVLMLIHRGEPQSIVAENLHADAA